MSTRPTLVWFRQDLRLDDNPALLAAARRGGPVVPVYLWAPEEEGDWPPGAASRWWLHQSLAALVRSLEGLGSRLLLRRGPALPALATLAKETGADAVFWNRRYEPASIARDTLLKTDLRAQGLTVESHNAALLFEPWEVQSREGKPYRVFTPFWKACLTRPEPASPKAAPARLESPRSWPSSLDLPALHLEPTIDWAKTMRASWTPGEQGARAQLDRLLEQALADYAVGRDQPAQRGTSRLSPHLHFGEISPRRIWQLVRAAKGSEEGATAFLREIGWREFAHHLLFHFPKTTTDPLREEFAGFPWRQNAKALRAWQRGRTGYPIVDAGMRELWATGWMHNRVRMIVASFLVKDLLLPWQEGAKWFWDTLVDADLANNTLGWQWTAGCGADAAPFFRVFNPTSQGEKFDPDGAYVRKWIPELKDLPAKWLHRPWEAPAEILDAASVQPGQTYPRPIVDHAEARAAALAAFAALSKSSGAETL